MAEETDDSARKVMLLEMAQAWTRLAHMSDPREEPGGMPGSGGDKS
jgi:hypothetical protein